MVFDPLANADGVLSEPVGDGLGVHAFLALFLEEEEDHDFQLLVGDGGPAFGIGGLDHGGGGAAGDFAELHLEVGDDFAGFGEFLAQFALGFFLEKFEAALELFDFLLGRWHVHGLELERRDIQ